MIRTSISLCALTGSLAVVLLVFLLPSLSHAYNISNWWDDGADILMDEVFSPAATYSAPAQAQMSEYNQIDTTDNSHPFRINPNPEFAFGANDGDNTIGFLGEAGLMNQYGLSYASALAWAISYSSGSGRRDECDIALDPTRAWTLTPSNSTWFQSTVLHELGHCRGLGHFNGNQSMQNSGQSKYLRNEDLYMDDKAGIRENASSVTEFDVAIYHKWHDGTAPQWMTMGPTTLREGDIINFNNIKIENRGTQAFGTLRFGVYLSENDVISTQDQQLNTGTFVALGVFSHSTFNWSATIPAVDDCTTRWIGAGIDDNGAYTERFENNNFTAFTNGNPFVGSTFTPTPLTLLLAEDAFEPNDSRAAAFPITLPFHGSDFTIDEDFESDFYEFTTTQLEIIEINILFADVKGNINLQLLNATGGVIASSSSGTDDEQIGITLPPGTYYVRVFGSGISSCNRYQVDIRAVECTTAADCSDGNVCNGLEVCFFNHCLFGSPLTCSEFTHCDAVEGCIQCLTPADCSDDNVCNGIEVCHFNFCFFGGNSLSCDDDGEFCNGVEGCDPVAGCVSGPPVDPSDGFACTLDSCDEVNDIVVNAPSDALCDNANVCDGNEVCVTGLGCIASQPLNCDDGQFCNGIEPCDTLAGCQAGTPANLDDGIACTDDVCDELLDQVIHVPDDLACDNAPVCTAGTCDEVGGCTYSPIIGCIPETPALPVWGLVAVTALLGSVGALRARTLARARPPAKQQA